MHKAKKITIKEADIDEEIIPVVKWINEFDKCLTTSSCQGYKSPHSASVTFICWSNFCFLEILKRITIFNEIDNRASVIVDVTYSEECPNKSVYNMFFCNKLILKNFIEFLKR
jgi:hypothetical protein